MATPASAATRTACAKSNQLTGNEGETCLAGSKDPNLYGYCYIDAEQGLGNPDLVATCEPNKKRVLRWVGEGLPANGSTMLMACLGATTL